MTAEQIFSICSTLALAGWLLLLFAGNSRVHRPVAVISGVILPLTLAVVYTVLVGAHWGDSHPGEHPGGPRGGFSTLAAVAVLFSNQWLLLAGWVHYLAFDLFIGAWEARDARTHGISHLLVIPCLLLTFLFGPVGLLLYLALRAARTKTIAITV
ncbi:MAG TPA: ABA4-like family protein [Bryobacteraceae bacterium]|nr:ABA4-like family protein [Bryobacteraceae bacterium]